MAWLRFAMGLVLGRRRPVTRDVLIVPGAGHDMTIRRTAHGIPCIEAETDRDAAFAIGFCHGQDRTFQLETLLRIARGTLSELVGSEGLSVDQLSRRIGFRRAADAQWAVLDDDIRDRLTAYTEGINTAYDKGITAKPHELFFLGGELSPWQPQDVLAFGAFQSFMLPGNWDVELARLRIAMADGIDAVRKLDPNGPIPSPPSMIDESVVDALSNDLVKFRSWLPTGGGSNNWVIHGRKTKSGKPILANDPHLAPLLPAPWYLVQVRLPDSNVAGATFAGSPAIPVGHNDHAAWGITAGLTDNTDLVIVDRQDSCHRIINETIRVKGGADVVEAVTITPHGPVISPIVNDQTKAIAMKAIWLEPRKLRGFLDVANVTSFDHFRAKMRDWPVLPLNVVYADRGGSIGYQLIGQLPKREGHFGTMPTTDPTWVVDVPFEELPSSRETSDGFFATANARPPVKSDAFLGIDFMDSYRAEGITDAMKARDDWDVASCQQLQLDVASRPWAEVRSIVLGTAVNDEAAREAFQLLSSWDGQIAADSPAAAVFELFTAELIQAIAKSAAPNRWADACGGNGEEPLSHNTFAVNRVGHLVSLLKSQPDGWFPEGWPKAIEESLITAVKRLREIAGPSPEFWGWGHLRPLILRHPILGTQKYLKSIFNLGPIPCGGDANTINQAANPILDVTKPTTFMPNLRAVMDVADWSNSRFVIAGGQSGNPCSPHFDDLFALWWKGEGVAIPFERDEVIKAAVETLRLRPFHQHAASARGLGG